MSSSTNTETVKTVSMTTMGIANGWGLKNILSDVWTVVYGKADFDYTLRSLQSYAKYSNVVWSSWKDTPKHIIDYLDEKKIPYVLNDLPAHSGMSNLNYQKTSFLHGLELARSLGAKYIFKARNDQEIINLDILLFNLKSQCEIDGKINLLCWDQLCLGPADYGCFGEINELEYYWQFPNVDVPCERYVLPQYFERKSWPYRFDYFYVSQYINTYIQHLDNWGVVINWFKRPEESPINSHFGNRAIYL